MLVIVVVVLIQGILTPSSLRGSFGHDELLINGGFFQAIGVISFGKISGFSDRPGYIQLGGAGRRTDMNLD